MVRRGMLLALVALAASSCGSEQPLAPPPPEKPCGENQIACGDECVDPAFDHRHCGGCDNACGELGCFGSACTTPASMHVPRGGCAVAVLHGLIYVIGGGITNNGDAVLKSVEVYDPRENTWTRNPDHDLPSPRLYAAAVGDEVGGYIYLTGGVAHHDGESPFAEVQRFDGEQWQLISALEEAREDHAIAIDRDLRVHVTSGNTHDQNMSGEDDSLADTTEVLLEDGWEYEGPTPLLGWGARAATGSDGRIYLTGGNMTEAKTTKAARSLFVFDPSAVRKAWQPRSDMGQGRFVHGAVFGPDGFLYVVGGFKIEDGLLEGMTSVERYNPVDDTWTDDVAPLPDHRTDTTAVVVGNRLYLPGGTGKSPGNGYAEMFVYDFDTERWYP